MDSKEILYRVIDKTEVYHFTLHDVMTGKYNFTDEIWNVDKGTGFKDKNGIEIFEGDVARYSEYQSRPSGDWELSEYIGFIGIEKFDFEDGHDVTSWGFNGMCLSSVCFGIEHDIKKMHDNKRDFAYRDWGSYKIKDMKLEVIGNIHQNPELLK